MQIFKHNGPGKNSVKKVVFRLVFDVLLRSAEFQSEPLGPGVVSYGMTLGDRGSISNSARRSSTSKTTQNIGFSAEFPSELFRLKVSYLQSL